MLKILTVIAMMSSLSIPVVSLFHDCQMEDGTGNIKSSALIQKHRKKIILIGNIWLLLSIVFWFYISMMSPINALRKTLTYQSASKFVILCNISMFILGMIMFTGIAGIFAGFLSYFRYHITTNKRIILLVICLLPAFLIIAGSIIHPQLNISSNDSLLIIKTGILVCSCSWLINGITIIFGRHFLAFSSDFAKILISLSKRRTSTG